ncbi:MAG: metal-dependent hydrolase [Chthoniobacterales bacterium]|nr:metal-dependent hydrolase [Chthoniobacterales bacterium]
MASPVAHSFAGFWTFLCFHREGGFSVLQNWRRFALQIGLLIFVANAADLDFLLSLYVRGNLNALHHGFTHSILFAAIVAVAFAAISPSARSFFRSSLIYFAAYGSHLLIDLVTSDRLGWNARGSGLPLFWPSREEWGSPIALFLGVQHKNFRALWEMQNALASLYELLVCGAITAMVLILRSKYEQNSQ